MKNYRSFLAAILFLTIPVSGFSQETEPFDYFANNWNVVGLKDYTRGSRIGPDNTIYLDKSQGSVKIRFGEKLNSLSREQGKTAVEGWMPVIQFSASADALIYEFTCWASPMTNAADWQAAYNWPVDGENFMVWIKYRISNGSDKSARAVLEIRNENNQQQANRSVNEPLKPGETIEGATAYSFFASDQQTQTLSADYKIWYQRTVDYWNNLIHSLAVIEVPDQKATEALKAAHVCQMIANDLGEVRGGEGFYDEFYIRDGAYQVMELEEAGMWDAARKSVDLYLPRQREDGRFESQVGQFDANGQTQWVLWQYYMMTRDMDYLKKVYPAMEKAAFWAVETLKSTRNNEEFPGLLPAAVADGEFLWEGKNHIVGYDFWNLRGLLVTADAAKVMGKMDVARELEKQAKMYHKSIDLVMGKIGLNYFPPSWELDGTPWGNTETLWPYPIFEETDKRVTGLIDYVRNDLGGGYIEGTIQWLGKADVIHPYMGAYTTMADLILGHDEKVVEDFYWYLLHSTAAHAFPEGIYYKTKIAWSNTIPHVTGACNYAIMLRHMLVHEDGDRLELLKAVPDWWLEPGRQVRIENLPTWFGDMDLELIGKDQGVEIKLTSPNRNTPSGIILYLPDDRPLLNSIPGVKVVHRKKQTQKWDFDKVIRLYSAED